MPGVAIAVGERAGVAVGASVEAGVLVGAVVGVSAGAVGTILVAVTVGGDVTVSACGDAVAAVVAAALVGDGEASPDMGDSEPQASSEAAVKRRRMRPARLGKRAAKGGIVRRDVLLASESTFGGRGRGVNRAPRRVGFGLDLEPDIAFGIPDPIEHLPIQAISQPVLLHVLLRKLYRDCESSCNMANAKYMAAGLGGI